MSVDVQDSAFDIRAVDPKTAVIDVDVHEQFQSVKDLLPYLDPHWQRYIVQYNWSGMPKESPYGVPAPGGNTRLDWKPDGGVVRASTVELMREQLLEGEGVSLAILNGMFHLSSLSGWFEFAAALASAYNDWQIEHWLEREPRLRGSVHVTANDPAGAAREIDRVAAHPQIVQVFLPTVTDRQYGDPFYRPIFEAAARNDLVVTLHHGSETRTALGYPRYFIEWHSAIPHANMCQLTSLVFNGLFDALPELKVVVLETGGTWIPHYMWRLDQQYRGLRLEVPWVKRLPSEHIRDNVRVATQPFDELSKTHFEQLIDMMGSDEMLMVSTDYPHFDADSPTKNLPAGLSDDLLQKIRFRNALATYPRL
jgi:predicted TIM-barrel fold metal-dependent hydrolase